MKFIVDARELRDADPIQGGEVWLRRERDNLALDSYQTDKHGLVMIERDGSDGPVRLDTTAKGITRRRASEVTGQRGAAQVGEFPYALKAIYGDGVAAGALNMLAARSASSGLGIVVESGVALAAGIQYTQYAAKTLTLASNTSGSTRVDRVVVRAWPLGTKEAGRCELAVVQGTPGAGTPALTQTATIWEEPIASATVVPGASSLSSVVDERRWLLTGSRLRNPIVTGVARRTTTTVGELGSNQDILSVAMTLVAGIAYDAVAEGAILVSTGESIEHVLAVDGVASNGSVVPGGVGYVLSTNTFARTLVGTGANIVSTLRLVSASSFFYRTAILTVTATPRS